jgi:hypothetical protein
VTQGLRLLSQSTSCVKQKSEIKTLMHSKIRLIIDQAEPGMDAGEILERVDAIEARLRELCAYGVIT